ncbi:MAG: tetratricopeptide repeat protein [Ignavibacteriales bacterium]|nr:tetratricopeptide repeat protein [Ignavibacteriales bacterium]
MRRPANVSPPKRGRAERTTLGVLLVAVLLVLAEDAHAQWIPDSTIDTRVQRGISHIYNMEFPQAEHVFAEVIQLRPEHPVGYFFRAMIQWWRILANYDDESNDQTFYDQLEEVVTMCEKRLDKDPNDLTALFFKGGAIGFRGRLRANRGKWVGAANDGMVALPLVRKAHALDPNNYDVLLGIGIYNYYADVIPDKYPYVKPVMFFFPSGDRKKGMEQLRQVSLNAKYAKTEATYFLMQNYFMYEKDYAKALELARQLFGKYPKNPLFHRYLGRALVSSGYVGEANDVFLEIEKRCRDKQLGYDRYDAREAYYYLGRYEFLGDRLDAALQYFYTCDELSRKLDKEGASGFMSMANLTIGLIYDLQGKRAHAEQQYRKVLAFKNYETTHEQAEKYLKQPYKR